ncbi:hypothetical protein GCM10022198_17390 [Klugiella xanthotipulae]
MQRFTFGQGNLRKLLGLPLYLAGGLLSLCIPRSSERWVFASGSGVGEGALEVYRAVGHKLPAHQRVWLVSSAGERQSAVAQGIPTASKTSLRGLWFTLRAGTIVITHGFGDVNRYGVLGATVVQLWHGIPLKKLHLDSPVTTQLGSRLPGGARRLLTAMYARGGRSLSIFSVASETAAARIHTAFRLSRAQIAITGDPRNDVLLVEDPARLHAEAREAVLTMLGTQIPDDHRLVLYAPTWRDGEVDPAIPTPTEWRMIREHAVAHAYHLVVRSHPLGVGDYLTGVAASTHLHLLGSDRAPHIMPFLAGFDAVVTDYSSIAFDFSLTGEPVVWFAPDLARYERSRGLYEPYPVTTERSYVTTWSGVVDRLADLGSRPEALAEARARSVRLAERHFRYRRGSTPSAERVVDEVLLHRLGSMFPSLHESPHAPVTPPPPVFPEPEPGRGVELRLEDVDDPVVTVTGRVVDGHAPVTRVVLQGMHDERGADTVVHADRWSAAIRLRASLWGRSELPPPSGDYEVRLVRGEGAAPELAQTTGSEFTTITAWCAVTVGSDAAGALRVALGPPLQPGELSSTTQAEREARYRTAKVVPENAVFFESFYGRVATCNPAALDREIARQLPGIRRYWSVQDLSVEVPAGATPIVEGSEEWWRVRGTARLLVVNDWLRKRWRPRPFQTVLQTWHGTMLKKLALSRPGVRARQGAAVILESRRWDILLSQNAHSTRIFRTSYAYRGPLWQVGYPRNDALVSGDRDVARLALQIPQGKRVALYAPTWREGVPELVGPASVVQLAERLGDDWVVLVRSHSRTHIVGRYSETGGVRDLSRYPELADLIVASDVVITDYSSVMFDATIADRPLVFFVPDLERYEEQERGFTFDIRARAPGPLTHNADELVDAVLGVEENRAAFAERYARWKTDFNAHDDGHASRRVVDRLRREGRI